VVVNLGREAGDLQPFSAVWRLSFLAQQFLFVP
jgi:hypothetical protein